MGGKMRKFGICSIFEKYYICEYLKTDNSLYIHKDRTLHRNCGSQNFFQSFTTAYLFLMNWFDRHKLSIFEVEKKHSKVIYLVEEAFSKKPIIEPFLNEKEMTL